MSVYRHRVRFEIKVPVRDSGNGNIEEVWNPAFSFHVPVAIETLTGRELIAAQQMHPQINTRIEMRYLGSNRITADMRAVNPYDNNRAYNVRAVLPDKTQRRFIVLLCESGVNEGE